MRRWIAVLGGLVALAWAHEVREVQGYRLVVGLLYNPAVVGQLNALDLRVQQGDKGLEGLEKSLKAFLVAPSGEEMELELHPAHGQPGAYRGWFIPTVAGNYTFRLEGCLAPGVCVKEVFAKYYHWPQAVMDPGFFQFPKPKEGGAPGPEHRH